MTDDTKTPTSPPGGGEADRNVPETEAERAAREQAERDKGKPANS